MAPVDALSVADGDQVYVVAPLAVNEADEPGQIEGGVVTLTEGATHEQETLIVNGPPVPPQVLPA